MTAPAGGPPPLAHLRIVDLCDLRGALAGRILADLGADVIHVEPPGGDPGRRRPPFAGGVEGPDGALAFLYRNLGKRGAVIDLGTAAGRARLAALCTRADVLLENLGPEAARRARLGPAAVRRRHPHLVHVRVADFGSTGPRAAWRLEALPAFAASGALWASGFPDRAPCWLPGWQAHDAAAIAAVAGALAALLDRARHGAGQTVEVSVQEAALAALAPWGIPLPDWARAFPVLPAAWPRDADGPAVVVPVRDGHVRLLALTPRQLRALVALVTGAEGPRRRRAPAATEAKTGGVVAAALATLAAQGRHAADLAGVLVGRLPVGALVAPTAHRGLDALRRVLGVALAARARSDVVREGLRLGLPIAPVHAPEEFVEAPQTRSRGFFRRTGFPGLDAAPVAPFPPRFARTPVVLRRPAPVAGEDDPGGFPARAAGAAGARPARAPILAGTRVVDLGVGAAVPGLCRVLADLGAEVVKIESAASIDFLRRITVRPGHPDASFMFADENRGQRSVCLDLRQARGRELALALCATADVVAENHRGGLVERLGLGREAVRAVRPDVVYLSSQGYGRDGPLGEAPAYGPLAAAFAGATFLWNHADAPYPGGSSLEHPDHVAAWVGAIAVLAALEHRRRTGEGQWIELSQAEVAAFLLGDRYLEAPLTGRPARPAGNAAPDACPHGVYPCAGEDAWVAIAAVGDAAWQRLRRALRWPADPGLATLAARLGRRDELDARLTRWTRRRSAGRAAVALQAAGVSAMPVLGPEALRTDAHLAARGALVTVDDPAAGPVRHVANPLRFGRARLAPPRAAPRLGADTEAVLVEALGLGRAELAALVAAGVCRAADA